MMNEEIRTIMTTNPTTAGPTDTIAQVSSLMLSKRLQQLPVIDDEGYLVGLITSYDLWRSSGQSDADTTLISQVMTTKIVKLAPKDKVGAAAELFMDKRFKTFPVVNLDNKLKGVITAFDVIRYSLRKEYPIDGILYREVM
jgi:CBS domain-containing protein